MNFSDKYQIQKYAKEEINNIDNIYNRIGIIYGLG